MEKIAQDINRYSSVDIMLKAKINRRVEVFCSRRFNHLPLCVLSACNQHPRGRKGGSRATERDKMESR